MCRFGRGYTLQVKIRVLDGSPNQVDAAGSKKSLRARSRTSLASGSAARMPTDSNDPLGTANKNFHNFVNETFQDVTLIEEHQVNCN